MLSCIHYVDIYKKKLAWVMAGMVLHGVCHANTVYESPDWVIRTIYHLSVTRLYPLVNIERDCLTCWPLGDLEVIFNLALLLRFFRSSYQYVLRKIPQNLTDDKSTLVQVMAWCCQATSHYLSQCWPRSMSPYGITRPQWVNVMQYEWLNPAATV